MHPCNSEDRAAGQRTAGEGPHTFSSDRRPTPWKFILTLAFTTAVLALVAGLAITGRLNDGSQPVPAEPGIYGEECATSERGFECP